MVTSRAQETSLSAGATNEQPRPDAGDELSFFSMASFTLRNWKLLVGLPLLGGAIVLPVNLLQSRTYTSSASFVPQGSSSGRFNLAGLAAQFGMAVNAAEPSQSPAFYADLLHSRTILRAVAETRFTFMSVHSPATTTLVERSGSGTTSERLESAIKRLRRNMLVTTSRETGIVSYSVKASDPILAQAIAKRVFECVNDFNIRKRQSRARAEREFVEARLNEVTAEVSQWEARLESFLRGNRDYANSPQLQLDHERLVREVSSRQQLREALVQSFEQARIDEVRDMPVVTLVEDPAVPITPDGRHTPGRVLVAGIVGAVLALIIGALRELLRSGQAAGRSDYAEFVALRSAALSEVVHPFRRARAARSAAVTAGVHNGDH